MKSKKIVSLGLVFTLAASMALTGCSGSKKESSKGSGDGKVQISFLNGFTGGDGEFMRKITDGFNESQDKYEVIESQEKDHYTKYKSGDYDMVVIHGDRLLTYAEDEMIQDVSGIYEKAGLKVEDFAQAGQDIVSMKDGVYAFPLDIHPLVMFYNKELVKEAPKTYEEIVSLQAELTAKNPDLYAMGVPGLGLVEFYYMTLANQNGIDLQKDGYLNFATEEFADTLLKFNEMIFTDGVSPEKLGLDGEFKTFVQDGESGVASQTAIALTGPWYYSAAKEKYGENLGIAAVPQIGAAEGVYGNAHTIAVSESVQDEAKIAGIAEFLKYVYQPEILVNWADAGQAPLHQATIDYIAENQEKYPLAYTNSQQFANCKIAPQVYNVGEQMRYINETVFNMIVSKEVTKEELMVELEKATKTAKQVSEDN